MDVTGFVLAAFVVIGMPISALIQSKIEAERDKKAELKSQIAEYRRKEAKRALFYSNLREVEKLNAKS